MKKPQPTLYSFSTDWCLGCSVFFSIIMPQLTFCYVTLYAHAYDFNYLGIELLDYRVSHFQLVLSNVVVLIYSPTSHLLDLVFSDFRYFQIVVLVGFP